MNFYQSLTKTEIVSSFHLVLDTVRTTINDPRSIQKMTKGSVLVSWSQDDIMVPIRYPGMAPGYLYILSYRDDDDACVQCHGVEREGERITWSERGRIYIGRARPLCRPPIEINVRESAEVLHPLRVSANRSAFFLPIYFRTFEKR